LVTTALRPIHRPIDRRIERLFFAGMALLILASVYVGFARSYYLAGVFGAPLPNTLIHVHGAVFTLWVVLLIAQTSLVTAGRVDSPSPPRLAWLRPGVPDGDSRPLGGN
jgi:hypothetical protein